MNSWLDEHLDLFVRPITKYIPEVKNDPNQLCRMWDQKSILALEGCWIQAKKLAGKRMMLLAGRDTWEFEILARMEGFPTVFRPDISTLVAISGLGQHPNGFWDFDRKGKPHPLIHQDYSEHYLIDSGWKGTVPKGIGVKNWSMVKYSPHPAPATPELVLEAKKEHQIFPQAKQIYKSWRDTNNKLHPAGSSPIFNLVSKLEGSPKYWTSAVVTGGKIVQKLAGLKDTYGFENAARVTQHIARNLTKVKSKYPGRVFIDMPSNTRFYYKVFGD